MREDRVFMSKTIYFFFMGFNLLLRFAWTLSLSTDIVTVFLETGEKYWFIYVTSMVEFLRRGIWNIFLIEK